MPRTGTPPSVPGLLLVALALAGGGCQQGDVLQVHLAGTLAAQPSLGPLSFDAGGRAEVFGRPYQAPFFPELERYGVVFFDAGSLPADLRPEHAADGGVLVSAANRAGPLAGAGLRVGDRVVEAQAAPVDSATALVALLQRRPEVELTVLRPNGDQVILSAAADPGHLSASAWGLTPVFEVASSATGVGFSLGPYASLFTYRSAALTDDFRYVDSTEWSFLLDLFHWESETPRPGPGAAAEESRSRFTLFWLISFGDDPFEAPRPQQERPQ